MHFVVPGGGVSDDGSRWLQTPENFLFAHAPAIALYKKLFARAMRKAGLYHHMPHGVLKKNWVVDIKPVGNGQAVLKYLAPYVYRVAISDNRIESVDDAGVTYRVTPSGGKRSVQRHATGEQFVRSFAQHILPSGFQKIRYYGFMSPNCKLQLANIRWLVWLFHASKYWLDVLAGQRLRTAGNDRTDHTDLQQLRRRVGTGRSGAGQRKSNPQQHAPRASTAINNRANCLMSNALHSLQSEQSEIHETLRCSVPLKVRTHRSLATDAGQSHRKTGAKKRRVAPSPAATWSGNRSTGRGWSRNHQLPDRHIGIKTQQRPA